MLLLLLILNRLQSNVSTNGMDMLQLAVRKVYVVSKVIHLGFTCYYDVYLH